MANAPQQMTVTRLQTNLSMLRRSLPQVFPAQEDRAFSDLLRRLDQAPTPSR